MICQAIGGKGGPILANGNTVAPTGFNTALNGGGIGDIARGGDPVGLGLRSSGTVGNSGNGASSPFSLGGRGRNTQGDGGAGGIASAGGGALSINGGGAQTGGNAGIALAIVTEFYD